jgi:hypothetical protein
MRRISNYLHSIYSTHIVKFRYQGLLCDKKAMQCVDNVTEPAVSLITHLFM